MSPEVWIGGFQRSGNTYLAEQVSRRYGITLSPEQRYNHDVSSHIEHISKRQNLLFIVPTRSAKDSLASYYVHEKKLNGPNNLEKKIESQLVNLINLWSFVLEHDSFFIAPFSKFTSDIYDFFVKLELAHPELQPFIDKNADLNLTYDFLISKELANIPKEIYLEVGHLPRERTPEYEKAVELINSKAFEEKFVVLTDMQKKLDSRY